MDAPLVADQCPKGGMLAQATSRASLFALTSSHDVQSLRAGDIFARSGQTQAEAWFDRTGREGTGLDTHLSDGRRMLRELKRSQLRAAEMRRFQDSMRWLDRHGSSYRGQWVALDGEKLLAAFASAKQVFSAVGDLDPAPLVIHVEEDETPFAGW
ncbi:MAG: hypothetical protein P4K98_08480 [Bryobacteraceae bacterium]|nr:hypothetical protein [Bryobacteraceae bacterium]